MMIITGLRMLADMLLLLCALIGGGVLFFMGDTVRGLTLAICCGIVAALVRPNNEERAVFHEFQKQRIDEHNRRPH